jgi:hypothetical protein
MNPTLFMVFPYVIPDAAVAAMVRDPILEGFFLEGNC